MKTAEYAMLGLGSEMSGGDLLYQLVLWLIGGLILIGLFRVLYYVFSLPLCRAEHARLFLDVLETGLQRGQSAQQTVLDLAKMHELSLGVWFHSLAAHLEKGESFEEALDQVPRFLPPQLVAMFKVGLKLGDLRKVLPACRRLLSDVISKTQGAESYLLLAQSFILPVLPLVFGMLAVVVLPKYIEIMRDMGVVPPPLTRFVLQSGMAVMLPVLGLTALLYVLIFIYLNGRQTVGWRRGFWSDLGDSLTVLLPWRWKRIQRDFSTLLAILLDAGIPEAEAVKLAAQGTANQVFIQRARQVIEDLRGGVKLTQAVQRLDGTGEFRWRLTNAVAGQNGFLAALAGWHEALDAKAYQQEQTAAHLVTTAFVLITGVLVGLTVTGIFGLLIAIINEGVLW